MGFLKRKNKIIEETLDIVGYLTKFNKMIMGKIFKAQAKFTCLQNDEAKEEILSVFKFKFTKAIIERQIQLWRVNHKMMNTYINVMLHNIISDEIEKREKEFKQHVYMSAISQQNNKTTDSILDKLIRNGARTNISINDDFPNGEELLIAKETIRDVMIVLRKLDKGQYILLKKLMTPGNDVYPTSPQVLQLRKRIKEIMEQLR